MRTFSRGYEGDFYAVIEKESIFVKKEVFVIGVFTAIEVFNAEPKPHYTFDKEFPTREMAEMVCEILSEEYSDAYGDGQASCY